MRVVALQPLFVTEAPPESPLDSVRAIEAGQARHSAVQATSEQQSTQGTLADETRAALRRLSALVRKRSRQREEEATEDSNDNQSANTADATEDQAKRSRGAPGEGVLASACMTRRQRVVAAYRYALEAGSREEFFGQFMDVEV